VLATCRDVWGQEPGEGLEDVLFLPVADLPAGGQRQREIDHLTVEERHPHLQRVRHAHLVGDEEQAVGEATGELEREPPLKAVLARGARLRIELEEPAVVDGTARACGREARDLVGGEEPKPLAVGRLVRVSGRHPREASPPLALDDPSESAGEMPGHHATQRVRRVGPQPGIAAEELVGPLAGKDGLHVPHRARGQRVQEGSR